MGRYKYDKYDISQLSPGTIEAIKNDLIKSEVDPQRYDWNVLQVRVKRANMAQRHRFKETLEKLQNYMTSDVVLYDMDGNACTFPVSSFQDENVM